MMRNIAILMFVFNLVSNSCSMFDFPELVKGEYLKVAYFYIQGNQNVVVTDLLKDKNKEYVNWSVKKGYRLPDDLILTKDGILKGNFDKNDIGKKFDNIILRAEDVPLRGQLSRVFNFSLEIQIFLNSQKIGDNLSPIKNLKESYFESTKLIAMIHDRIEDEIYSFRCYLNGHGFSNNNVKTRNRYNKFVGFFSELNDVFIKDIKFNHFININLI